MVGQPDSPRDSIEQEEEEALLSPTGSPDIALPAASKKPWLLLVVLIFTLVAFVDIGAFLSEPPQTRIFEANLCLKYYREEDPSVIKGDGTIPEELCKVDEVQQRLASIFGWQEMFNAIPGLLLAVPFGTLADRIGRKWIFTASLVGIVLSFAWTLLICEYWQGTNLGCGTDFETGYFKSLPLQLVWFSSAFTLIGGGAFVTVALALTMLADIAPAEHRTTIFLYLTTCIVFAEMVGPIIASRLMDKGDWLPLMLALALEMVGVVVALFLPETLHLRDLPEPKDNESFNIELQPVNRDFSIRSQLRNFQDAALFLWNDWTLALVVLTFLVNRLGRQSISLLVRYASKRYIWEIKKAAYLLSFRAATNLVAVSVILPLVNYVLLKKLHFPAHKADMLIACGSITITTASFFVMGVAAYPALLIIGLLIYNMGSGYNAAMRSISIHVVGGQSSPNIGKLMSTIAMAESFGAMIGGPLLNELFQLGIGLGGGWLGLPFLGSAVAFAFMAFVTFTISVRGKEPAYVEVHGQDLDAFHEVTSSQGYEDASGFREAA